MSGVSGNMRSRVNPAVRRVAGLLEGLPRARVQTITKGENVVKSTVIVSVCAGALVAGCSSGPQADEVSWGNLPEGTQEWISDAVAADDCEPIRVTREYVAIFEDDQETPSEAYVFLEDAYDRMNCDQLSADEQLKELFNMDIGVDDVERLSAPKDNPLYFGPGCIGTVRTLGAVREPRPQDDAEATLTRLYLASRALLDSLPDEVTKTGTREPTASEDAAMRAASALIALGDGLLADNAAGDEQFQEVLDELPFLEQELNFACILEYEDGATGGDQ